MKYNSFLVHTNWTLLPNNYTKVRLLLPHPPYHRIWDIPRNDLRVVQHVIFLCRIASRIERDRLLASRVVWSVLGNVEYLLIDNCRPLGCVSLIVYVFPLPPVLGADVAAPKIVPFTVSGCALRHLLRGLRSASSRDESSAVRRGRITGRRRRSQVTKNHRAGLHHVRQQQPRQQQTGQKGVYHRTQVQGPPSRSRDRS